MGLMDLLAVVPLYFRFAFCSLVTLSLHRINLADNVFVPLLSLYYLYLTSTIFLVFLNPLAVSL